jgi:hypothetical protein
MNKAEVFEIWAPANSVWSPWAKPVLFAEEAPGEAGTALAPQSPKADIPSPGLQQPCPHLMGTGQGEGPALHLSWVPAAAGQTAMVLDLPGELSVHFGLALAQRGYRPVPLYNAAPGPNALVDVAQIQRILFQRAPELQTTALPPEAPPAFLLDSARLGHVSLSPGRFDNRWMVFPEDFPSANFLLSRGIGCVLLVQDFVGQPQKDLAHALLRWQESRLSVMVYGFKSGGTLEPITISRPSHFKQLWYRALVMAGLRRHSGGGFGAMVPDVDTEGGFG